MLCGWVGPCSFFARCKAFPGVNRLVLGSVAPVAMLGDTPAPKDHACVSAGDVAGESALYPKLTQQAQKNPSVL